MNYEEFLHSKAVTLEDAGIEPVGPLNPMLYDFQSDIVRWALRKGRAAVFCDCGLGKTPIQLEWAALVPGKVLILAPLAVATQTMREGEKFGIPCTYSREGSAGKITITNYEMLPHFDPSEFDGIVLDESSILKSYSGKTRTAIIDAFADTRYKLACTATPAPNDYMELGNHAEFFGIMTRAEMLSMFFVHDGGETQKWRIKGHAQDKFWEWMCTWSVMLRKPSDLHYDDGAFLLPPITYIDHVIDTADRNDGMLFEMPAATLQDRISARSNSVVERSTRCADIVNASSEQWLVWCNRNDESAALKRLINGSVEVKGSDMIDHKEKSLNDFALGRIRVMVTKPTIAGYGMNFQSCHNMAFVGLSDSWEQWYQAVRRCWRFGQESPVNVHVITSKAEGAVVANIKRKEEDAAKMAEGMLEHMATMNETEIREKKTTTKNKGRTDKASGEGWDLYLGDSVEVCRTVETDSIGYSVFSPPFASLYTYSDSERDMGNSRDYEEFFHHFAFLLAELYRVTAPGRLVSMHCMDLPTSLTHHGWIGLIDFPGELIRSISKEGFHWHAKTTIWKNPVTSMQRTKALGLLHKQLKKDSTRSRMGIPDYILTFRKPGDNAGPVEHSDESFPVSIWQKWASPIWDDINPSNTLQRHSAREHKDERHIAPLQLDVIERCLTLWSNRGDLVLSPFAGIGSEGYVALQMGRRFIGVELKESYWNQARKNLASAREQAGELFRDDAVG